MRRRGEQLGIYDGRLGWLARALDQALGVVAPRAAARRLEARAVASALLSFDAARNKRTRRTNSTTGSADQDLLIDLPTMRTNSRTMVRDDGVGSAAVRVFEENVVGTGLQPQMMVTGDLAGVPEKVAQQWNRDVEQVWADWEGEEADAGERMTFAELQRLAIRSVVVDGEFLLHRTVVQPEWAPWRSLVTAFEPVDPDRVLDPVTLNGVSGQMRSGVEVGDRGQAIAYWITPRHPQEYGFLLRQGQKVLNVPERFARFSGGLPSILHLYQVQRPGQTRGIPFFAPVYSLVESLNDMIDTEAIAAKAASRFCAFIRQTLDSSAVNSLVEDDGDGNKIERLEPGTVRYLGPGEEIQSFSPNRPSNTWDPFVDRLLKSICGALGLPFQMVVRDFSGMNYSSARVALLEARRGFEALQQLLMVPKLCNPVLRCVVFDAISSGRLTPPRGFADQPRRFLQCAWQPPAWGWVDPTKEIEASAMAVEANLSTPQAEAARQGTDVEQVLEQRGRFLAHAREVESRYGLPEGALTQRSNQPSNPAVPDQPAAAGDAGAPPKP